MKIKSVKGELGDRTLTNYISQVKNILIKEFKIDKKDTDTLNKYYENLDLWLYNKNKIDNYIDNLKTIGTKKVYYSTILTLLNADGEKNEDYINYFVNKQKEIYSLLATKKHTDKEEQAESLVSKKQYDKLLEILKHNLTKQQEYLILLILWYIPLRNEVGTLQNIKSTKFKTLSTEQLKDNYLITSTKDIKLHLADYKTSKTYGVRTIKIEDKKLKTAIREYINRNKHKDFDYLFTHPKKFADGNFNEPLGTRYLTNLLSNISKKHIGVGLTETNIFKSVIRHNLDRLDSIEDKRDFLLDKSQKRGTSLNTILDYYNIPIAGGNKTENINSE